MGTFLSFLTFLIGSAMFQSVSGPVISPPVQTASAAGGASATVTLATPVVPNSLIAFVFYFDDLTIPSGWAVSSVSGTATCPQYSYSGQKICMLQRPVTPGIGTSFTFGQSSSDGISVIVEEIQGAGNNLTVSAMSGGSAGAGPMTPPPATPTVVGTLAIEVFSPSNVTTPTAPAGWTLDQNQTGTPYHSGIALHQNATTTDTTTPISQTVAISPAVSWSNSMTVLIAPGATDPHPVAIITGSTSPIVNVPSTYSAASSYDPNGLPLSYAWTFGDGATSTAVSPSHTFAATGSRTVSLTVTNSTALSGGSTLPVVVQAPRPTFLQTATCPTVQQHLPLICTLTGAPNPNDLITVIVPFGPYPDFDFIMPDVTWTYTIGGRTGVSANPYSRVAIFTHTAVPGESGTYTFYPVSNNGTTTLSGSILESYDTLTPQVAYAVTTSPGSSVNSPPLTPVVAGSLPLVGAPNTASVPAGYSLLSSPFTLAQGPLTLDATTPISATLTGYAYSNMVYFALLYPPGILPPAPTASPAAGTYGTAQTVTLTATQPIRYALDTGVANCATSPLYVAPLVLDRTTDVSLISCGAANSAPVLFKYVIGPGTLLGVGLDGDMHGRPIFGGDAWHTNVSGFAVDPHSDAIIARLDGSGRNNIGWDGAIQYRVVDSTPGRPYTTPLVPVSHNLDPYDENYGGEYTMSPLPTDLPIEGAPPLSSLTGDNHANAFDRAGALYATWRTSRGPITATRPSVWAASVLAIFDLTLPTAALQRPYNSPSETAGGSAELESFPRWDEMKACLATFGQPGGCTDLGHAFRMNYALGYFACDNIGSDCYGTYAYPTSHAAGLHYQARTDPAYTYYGQRSRYKASLDCSSMLPAAQIVCNTGKRFGFIVDDVGGGGSAYGTNFAYDPHWDQTMWDQLSTITSASLEMLAPTGTIYSSADYPVVPIPVISSFTASPSTAAPGAPVTLSWATTGQTYNFIDLVGLVRGTTATITAPATPGTYTYTLRAQGVNYDLGGNPQTYDGNPITRSLTLTVSGLLPSLGGAGQVGGRHP